MIAIQTNKDFIFNTSRGKIKMEIDLIQNKPLEGIYEMRIIDSVSKMVTENVQIGYSEQNQPIYEEKTFEKVLDKKAPRFKTLTYAELDTLAENLNVDMTTGNLRENYNELYRQGLLLFTQNECINGITGEAGFGMYFTQAQDWEVVPTETTETPVE